MYKSLVVLLLIMPLSTYGEERNNSEYLSGLLINAKATGMCGVFGQMARFQESTKMPGGDEFIIRFLNTESARLGHTTLSFMKECPKVIKNHAATMKSLNNN